MPFETTLFPFLNFISEAIFGPENFNHWETAVLYSAGQSQKRKPPQGGAGEFQRGNI